MATPNHYAADLSQIRNFLRLPKPDGHAPRFKAPAPSPPASAEHGSAATELQIGFRRPAIARPRRPVWRLRCFAILRPR